jgi:hypothetical protein
VVLHLKAQVIIIVTLTHFSNLVQSNSCLNNRILLKTRVISKFHILLTTLELRTNIFHSFYVRVSVNYRSHFYYEHLILDVK